jgi:hypothetical protein
MSRTWSLNLGALAIFCAGPAFAQRSAPLTLPRIGLGVVASAPEQFLGGSAHIITPLLGGLGLYVDAKVDIESPREEDGFIEGLTAQEVDSEFGDELFDHRPSWTNVNVALMRPVSAELIVYAGAGRAKRADYRQYIDPEQERGVQGFYWVEDPGTSGTEINLLGGAFFRIGRSLLIQFGAESKPRGVTVGVAYSHPL